MIRHEGGWLSSLGHKASIVMTIDQPGESQPA